MNAEDLRDLEMLLANVILHLEGQATVKHESALSFVMMKIKLIVAIEVLRLSSTQVATSEEIVIRRDLRIFVFRYARRRVDLFRRT